MDVLATVTSRGQVTIPLEVRRRLGLEAGDRIIFHVEDDQVTLAAEGVSNGRSAAVSKVPSFIDLAGTVPTPPELTKMSWQEIREQAWKQKTERLSE